MKIASLENISLKKNNKNILENINLDLEVGKITTLIGPNGGGKTSIARILIRSIKPSDGSVTNNATKIGYMPQKIEIEKSIPMRVIDFIGLCGKKSQQEILEFVQKFSKLNIEQILYNQFSEISGGQMQKVLFLRSIIEDPQILILDEPTQYMDIIAIKEFYRIIDDIRKGFNCAILLISHDLHAVMKKSDFVFCINKHICCHGVPNSINEHPEYLAMFEIDNEIGLYKHEHNHIHKH